MFSCEIIDVISDETYWKLLEMVLRDTRIQMEKKRKLNLLLSDKVSKQMK